MLFLLVCILGATLTWALVRRTNVQWGTAEIWRAFAATPLTNVTVTATMSQATPSSMTVMSFSGVDTSGTNGAGAIGATGSGNAQPGAPTATLATTRANSWVVGVGNDWDAATARTLGPNQTMVHEYMAAAHSFWVQRMTTATTASGANVTINDTAPTSDRYNLTTVEVRSSGSTDATPPTVAMTAPSGGATVSGTAVVVSATASDNVGVAGVQFKVDGADLGAEDTTSPYSVAWDTTTATAGTHTLTAVARDAAGNTTTSAAVSVTVSNPLPTAVMFTASTDHNTTVTSYLFEVFANGADPTTALPVASSDLGKPTPDANGDITVGKASFFSALAPGTYVSTVSAIAASGKGRSQPVTFTR